MFGGRPPRSKLTAEECATRRSSLVPPTAAQVRPPPTQREEVLDLYRARAAVYAMSHLVTSPKWNGVSGWGSRGGGDARLSVYGSSSVVGGVMRRERGGCTLGRARSGRERGGAGLEARDQTGVRGSEGGKREEDSKRGRGVREGSGPGRGGRGVASLGLDGLHDREHEEPARDEADRAHREEETRREDRHVGEVDEDLVGGWLWCWGGVGVGLGLGWVGCLIGSLNRCPAVGTF